MPQYDSYYLLLANCAPASERHRYNLTANVTYRNANGHLTCGEQPYPAMYSVCTSIWAIMLFSLILQVLRDVRRGSQQNYATKNVLLCVLMAVPVAFCAHGQVSSAAYVRIDRVGFVNVPPYSWLEPALYVLREFVMYGVVIVFAAGWRVAPREDCRNHLFSISLFNTQAPIGQEQQRGHKGSFFVRAMKTVVLAVNCVTAFFYDYKGNKVLVCQPSCSTLRV